MLLEGVKTPQAGQVHNSLIIRALSIHAKCLIVLYIEYTNIIRENQIGIRVPMINSGWWRKVEVGERKRAPRIFPRCPNLQVGSVRTRLCEGR